ncbi:MAG: hypothetical protein RI885_85 [Actinomycetota bacterium]|jgi:CP family cyanate transporter-like MFS transporter
MTARSARVGAVVVGILLVGLLLRGPIVAVAPVTATIRGELDLSSAQLGLLTSLPVLCFAIMTPFASRLIGRAGANLATTIAIVGVGAGSILRSAGGLEATIVGTVLIGAFVTIGNVVVPVIIRRDIPRPRVGIVTGAYTSSLNVGSMITSIATAPLAEQFGWRGALVTWTAFSLLALAGWLLAIGPRAAARWGTVRPTIETGAIDTVAVDTSGIPVPRRSARTWTSATAVLLSLAFAGQAFSYYGLTAWLPTILADEVGLSASAAGTGSSVFQVAAIAGALGVPLIAARRGLTVAVCLVAVTWLSAPIGLLLAPEAWLLWGTLGGAAQGGGITVVFVLVVHLSRSGAHARGLSAMVQGVGYALAATAPTLVGAARDATGGWVVPLLVVLGALLVFTGCGFAGAYRTRSRAA